MGDDSGEYVQLTRKVDDGCREASQAAGAAVSCRQGCDGCCQVWLSVSEVEADAIRAHIATLPEEARASLSERGLEQGRLEREDSAKPRCAMLDEHGGCSIYEARPMICRTQGLALQFPKGTLHESTVRWRSDDGKMEFVACPLNYTGRAPTSAEILDSDLLNTLLGVVNVRHTGATRGDPEVRTPLLTLAAQASVLA